jgi:hypothetical protein
MLGALMPRIARRVVADQPRTVTTKSDRQAARQAVAAFHEAQLAGLVEHVGSAVDRFRSGHMDAFAVDRVLFQYARAAKELWKLCNLGDPELVLDSSATAHPWIGGSSGRQRRGERVIGASHAMEATCTMPREPLTPLWVNPPPA